MHCKKKIATVQFEEASVSVRVLFVRDDLEDKCRVQGEGACQVRVRTVRCWHSLLLGNTASCRDPHPALVSASRVRAFWKHAHTIRALSGQQTWHFTRLDKKDAETTWNSRRP